MPFWTITNGNLIPPAVGFLKSVPLQESHGSQVLPPAIVVTPIERNLNGLLTVIGTFSAGVVRAEELASCVEIDKSFRTGRIEADDLSGLVKPETVLVGKVES